MRDVEQTDTHIGTQTLEAPLPSRSRVWFSSVGKRDGRRTREQARAQTPAARLPPPAGRARSRSTRWADGYRFAPRTSTVPFYCICTVHTSFLPIGTVAVTIKNNYIS
ncbi:unnamed protein product [Pieris brassicae]|uniref:Uncharacterized protein n=1 Tax=Pieris brassicae TaxID=7116 RepID=A0A9P0XBR7_PIEBR|nr:unnamed protein product [Pieris brassicae]